MPRKKNRYMRYCGRIYSTATYMIGEAIETPLRQWCNENPDVKECIEERGRVIELAQQAVNAFDPNLKVSGPVSDSTTLQYIPQWIRESSDPWFIYRGPTQVFMIELEHKPILTTPGGAFSKLLNRYGIPVDKDTISIVTIRRPEMLQFLPENLRYKVEWASDQYKLLVHEFGEWTGQFREENDKRAFDLAFYFSPVFSSFASLSKTKVFSSRPRVEEYIPMSNELASLLTMTRASRYYREEATQNWSVP